MLRFLLKFCLLLAPALLTAPANAGATATPQHTAQPNVHVLPQALTMPGLERQRTIRVYLPPGYEGSTQRYPVLYMHDGQNLFDAATAYAGEWGVDETLNELAKTHHLQLIVVGIDNGAEKRITELNPWDNARFGKGEGRQYVDFIVDVVKPAIDRMYRTLPDRMNTGIMGSSLGGLITHYAVFQYPQVFGKAGIFSPSYWIVPDVFPFTAAHKLPADTKLYFYAGGKEGDSDDDMVGYMRKMVGLIRQSGFPADHLSERVNPEGHHNEPTWRAEFPAAVLWLFGDSK